MILINLKSMANNSNWNIKHNEQLPPDFLWKPRIKNEGIQFYTVKTAILNKNESKM